jgi:hypothetical protein
MERFLLKIGVSEFVKLQDDFNERKVQQQRINEDKTRADVSKGITVLEREVKC